MTDSATTSPLLQVDALHMRFGGLTALNNISFTVNRGSITALIGPNGAGKTTLFNCLTGFYQATQGALYFYTAKRPVCLNTLLGQTPKKGSLDISQSWLKHLYYRWFGGSHLIAQLGIARTFQNIRLFRDMTVLENLLVAQHRFVNRHLLPGIVCSRRFRDKETQAMQRAMQWLRVIRLEHAANQLAGSLPYGHQRHLEIARALCTQPALLCLDEPAAGLNPSETAELSALIHTLREEHHVTILLIEHDMRLVMRISDQVIVLDHGEVIADDTPAVVVNDQAVLNAYLGNDSEHE